MIQTAIHITPILLRNGEDLDTTEIYLCTINITQK